MKTVTITCCECNKSYERNQSRYNRDVKEGKRVFCSLSCNRIKQNKERTDFSFLTDELSPFRYHLANLKRRAAKKNIKVNITLSDLKSQWDKQKGLCVYSGRAMDLQKSTNEKSKLHTDTASLDRIIPSKGYCKHNIQWVCIMAQYAKNIFDENDLITFCEDVSNHQCDLHR